EEREVPGAGEGPGASGREGGARAVVERERRLEVAAPLPVPAAEVEVPGQAARDPQCVSGPRVAARDDHRLAEVVELGVEPPQPAHVVDPEEALVGAAGEVGE